MVLRDLSISLARMMHTSLFPFLAASFIERLTFSSSRCMPLICRSSLYVSFRMVDVHCLT
ncbi:hypothetical protein FWK35_00022873 [Aphis craccivora]|uniref:Uncharacterized protein n=1 Tax=Aphis craccivora TaxID=307492 RepID=A0A6G0WLR0_APHCR|nr:hypothetical protein FWK35_00022873 [Aphis craccivora]